MSTEDNNFALSIIKLLKETSLQSIVRWVAGVHNFIAPGYLYVYMFQYKQFNELSTFKLLLLAFVLSTPITYLFYVLVGNFLRWMAYKKILEQEYLRINALIWITVLVVALDAVIFISGLK